MDIVAEKSFLIKKLEQTNDEALLKAIHELIEQAQLGSEMDNMNIKKYNQELDEAEADIAKGNFVVHEEAIERIKGWRKEK